MGIWLLSFFIIFIIFLQVPISFITIHGLLVFSRISVVIQSWFLWKYLIDYTLGPSLVLFLVIHGSLTWMSHISASLNQRSYIGGNFWNEAWQSLAWSSVNSGDDLLWPRCVLMPTPARKQPTPIHLSGLCFCSPHNAGAQEEWGWLSINSSMQGQNKTPLT